MPDRQSVRREPKSEIYDYIKIASEIARLSYMVLMFRRLNFLLSDSSPEWSRDCVSGIYATL